MSKASYKKREMDADFELLLFPMMDMLCSLIPLLLCIVSFFNISYINTSIVSKQPSLVLAKDKKFIPLDLNLEVSKAGIQLSSNQIITERQKNMTIPNIEGKFNFEILQDILFQLKNRYPGNDTIVLSAQEGVKYDEVINVMDACRSKTITPGKPEKEDLFTKVAIIRK